MKFHLINSIQLSGQVEPFQKGNQLVIDFETRITTCLSIHALLPNDQKKQSADPNFKKIPDVLFIAAMGHEIYVPRQMKYSHNHFRDK